MSIDENRFQIGDRVECIDTSALGSHLPPLTLGAVYTIRELHYMNERSYLGGCKLVELETNNNYSITRFKKLDKLKIHLI